MRHVAGLQREVRHAPCVHGAKIAEANDIAEEAAGLFEVGDVEMDVPDARAGRHGSNEVIVVRQHAHQHVDVQRGRWRLRGAVRHDRDALAVAGLEGATLGRLECQLDAVSVRIREVRRHSLGVIGRAIGPAQTEEARDDSGQFLLCRQVDGNVVEPGVAGDDRPARAGMKDEHLVIADAESDALASGG